MFPLFLVHSSKERINIRLLFINSNCIDNKLYTEPLIEKKRLKLFFGPICSQSDQAGLLFSTGKETDRLLADLKLSDYVTDDKNTFRSLIKGFPSSFQLSRILVEFVKVIYFIPFFLLYSYVLTLNIMH